LGEKPSIVIVEDHPVMREGLAAWFTATGNWCVTGTAASFAEAKALFSRPGFHADIALLDIQLEDGWGLDIIPWLSEKHLPCPLVAVYSMFDDYPHVSTALGLGVRAYVSKRRSESELDTALKTVLAGGTWIDDKVQIKFQIVSDMIDLLTKREAEILTLVKSGLSNKDIALRLGISRRTVENILSCVYDKTGVRSRLDLERM
jgi:NarL family two-component system response regulator LiaR